MGNFWTGSTPINVTNLDNCAPPLFNCSIGTNGTYTSLNSAIAAGATRIAVLPGATLTGALTISVQCCIIGIFPRAPITGNYTLTISAADCLLWNIRRTNSGGVGLVLTGGRCSIQLCSFQSCSSHGLHLNDSSGSHVISDSVFYANGGDGIRLESTSSAMLSGIRSQTNTGYGLNDLTNNVVIASGRFNANTAGSINGSSTLISAAVYAP